MPGEFGGLFGDDASAFPLCDTVPGAPLSLCRMGEFFFGCAGEYAAAICVNWRYDRETVNDYQDGRLNVQFDGEALSRAAITRMEKVLAEVELRSGIPRSSVGAFATHQPNPRLVALLAKQLGVSPDTFPPIAQTCGNLGSSTCGSVLHAALLIAAESPLKSGKAIFLTSLGPGLILGGGWLVPATQRDS